VKSYVYVSDSKIDMLYEEIPKPWLDRITAELKIDLEVVSLTLKRRPGRAVPRGNGNAPPVD
jgi:hypothetical protein